MIELKDNELHFFFPDVQTKLRNLAKHYTEEKLPQILEEDRNKSLNQILKNYPYFRFASEKEQEDIRHFVQTIPKEKISEAFQNKVNKELQNNSSWSEPGKMTVQFQRTLRIPDDRKNYNLPAELGSFPLCHIDDFADRAPSSWLERGGVLMPMYQAEALWIDFGGDYPFAVKIGSGKINAVTGENWRTGLNRQPQDYLVLPDQTWLDGFAVEKGIIRQFVAMPLGSGYSVEEQLTGAAEFGGIQIQVFPMKAEIYFRDEILPSLPRKLSDLLLDLLPKPVAPSAPRACCAPPAMGLGAGGRMKQEIYEDEYELEDWDILHTSRCFVHLCNSLAWREITGTNPPHPPVTAREYERHNLPWFDFYRDDLAALDGSDKLASVKSVATLSASKGDGALLDNDTIQTSDPISCGPKHRPNEVREWLD